MVFYAVLHAVRPAYAQPVGTQQRSSTDVKRPVPSMQVHYNLQQGGTLTAQLMFPVPD